jgi:hypothetical protein
MDLISALPEEVFNEIASYLNGKDVLNSSLVCKRWNQLINQSYECMKKITAKYTNYNYKIDLTTLLSSERKYQNIKIGFKLSQYIDYPVEQNIKGILKKFSNSIVTLETTHDIRDICELPRLRELHFVSSNFQYYYRRHSKYFESLGLLEKCTQIKKLCIQSPDMLDDGSLDIIQKAFTKMQNLKSLTVNEPKIVEITECCFRLEEISLKTYETDAEISFLKAHQSTLKVIKLLDHVPLEDIAVILSEFPKLHTLHIKSLDFYYSFNNVDFPQNESIKNFIISDYISGTSGKFPNMLVKLKKLEHLKVRDLSWETISATPHCSALKTIEHKGWDSKITKDQKNWMKKNLKVRLIKRRAKYVYT